MGGSRTVMVEVYARMRAVITDPHLSAKERGVEINVNQGALNYIAYHNFPFSIVTGPPLHSDYKKYESDRADVWIIHKLIEKDSAARKINALERHGHFAGRDVSS